MTRILTVSFALLLSARALAADPPAPAAPTAPAAPAAAPAPTTFEGLDLNKDGALDATEAGKVAALGAEFAALDADKNTKLAKAEFEVWAAKQAKPASAPAAPAK